MRLRNALQLGVFRGLLKSDEAKAASANIDADMRACRLVKTSLRWPAVFGLAARLSERHAAITGTRSLDILHVAAAKTLHAVRFASFDRRPVESQSHRRTKSAASCGEAGSRARLKIAALPFLSVSKCFERD
jgi:hypothetical protein